MIRFPWFQRSVTLLTAVTVLSAPAALFAFPQSSLTISAGNPTGTYYAVSSAIAKTFNPKSAEHGVRLATVASPGSVANIDSVADGKAALGIAETELLKHATQGGGPWEGKARKGLRAVMGLFIESITIVAAADSGINRVSDLKGKRFNIGAPGSIDHAYAAGLLKLAGLNPAEITLSQHSAAMAPELLKKEEIDAYIYTSGHPNLSVLEASTGSRKVLLVPLDDALIRQLVSENPLMIPVALPTRFYPSIQFRGTVPTIGVRSVLFTRADVAEETVYRLVREVLTNFEFFKRQHPVLQDLTPRQAASIKVIPLHPGAARYFREAGLLP